MFYHGQKRPRRSARHAFALLPVADGLDGNAEAACEFKLRQAGPAAEIAHHRCRARLTQLEFAARLGVPVETIRNWEQGKRMPRGPARALLAVIAHAPETVFSALAKA